MLGPLAWYLEIAFDDAGADAQPPVGQQVVQDAAADVADQVDDGAGDDVGGLGKQVAGGVEGDGEAAAAGVDAAGGLDRVGDGDAQDLVAGQEGVDLLGDAGGAAGAQHPAAEDGRLQFQVGGFDFPALVVKGDQRGCRVLPVVGQGGGQPVDASVPPGAGGDGDLAFDHP